MTKELGMVRPPSGMMKFECSKCFEDIEDCADCGNFFEVGDDVYCIEGEVHLCRFCMKKGKVKRRE